MIFSEPVQDGSFAGGAEKMSYYSIENSNGDSLGITSVVRDDINTNIVKIYTEFQSPLTYTLTIDSVADSNGNPIIGELFATFSGMGAVSVDNGPVGNTISGIGNLSNQAVTAFGIYDNKFYMATYNAAGSVRKTEIFVADETGVYYTMVNNPGFNPPIDSFRQRNTSSFAAFDIDSNDKDNLFVGTSDNANDPAYVFKAEDDDGTGIVPADWTEELNLGNNDINELLVFGIDEASEHLYVLLSGKLYYWDPLAGPAAWQNFDLPLTLTASCYIDFGGRMYIGGKNGTTMEVWRSKGTDAGYPKATTDFEEVLDATALSVIGMNGYDAESGDGHFEDSNNENVTSIAVFQGYIYIGTENVNGAQVWRSQDGLTWDRVLDFGSGSEFNGIGDSTNLHISSMQVNGNYLYVGTGKTATGAEVWRTPDGVTWNLFGSDGFGSDDYIDVTAMESYLNMIYFGMESTSVGGAIFRANN